MIFFYATTQVNLMWRSDAWESRDLVPSMFTPSASVATHKHQIKSSKPKSNTASDSTEQINERKEKKTERGPVNPFRACACNAGTRQNVWSIFDWKPGTLSGLRWISTFSSQVNLHHTIKFRAVSDAKMAPTSNEFPRNPRSPPSRCAIFTRKWLAIYIYHIYTLYIYTYIYIYGTAIAIPYIYMCIYMVYIYS